MSGQAAACTREEVRSKIKSLECNTQSKAPGGGGSGDSLKSMKTTSNK